MTEINKYPLPLIIKLVLWGSCGASHFRKLDFLQLSFFKKHRNSLIQLIIWVSMCFAF